MENLHDWIGDRVRNGPVAIVTGRNGDMDTVGSAIALSSTRPELLACGLHLGRLAKRMCNELNAPFKIIAENGHWPDNLSGFIFVDAASLEQTGVKIPQDIPYCVIDHHATSEWTFGEHDLEFRTDARSTTQIIFQYLENYYPNALTDEVRKLLLAGLITDTGRFQHADQFALATASRIVSGGNFEYQEFVEHLQNEKISSSDRGAIIKALNNCKSIDVGDWNLVHTNGGIQEGKIASLLLQTGGDVSLVCRTRNGKSRLTARANRNSTKQGVHLGNLMKELSTKIGGEGGGHDGAAGWSGNADPVSAESGFINLLAGIRRREK